MRLTEAVPQAKLLFITSQSTIEFWKEAYNKHGMVGMEPFNIIAEAALPSELHCHLRSTYSAALGILKAINDIAADRSRNERGD